MNAHLVEDVDAVQVLSGLAQTGSHGFLSSTKSHTRIVVLLVRLVRSVWASDLSLEEIVVLGLVLTDSVPESPLGVGVNVHLDDTGLDGVLDVFCGGSGTTVEDELHWLGLVVSELLLDVLLGVVKDFRSQLNVTRGVDTVDVSEGSSAGEGTVRDLGKLLVGVPDFLRLSVETGRVDIGVVNTILLTSGDTELELEKHVALGHAREVILADADVLLEGLLGQVKHVGGEEWSSGSREVSLVGVHQRINPWQPSLLAMVGVKNDWDTVKGSDLMDVLGSRNGSSDGGLVISVVNGLSADELSTTLGESDHDWSTVLGGSFHAGVDGVSSNNVDTRDGELLLLGVIEEINKGLSSNNTSLDGSWELGESDAFLGGAHVKSGGANTKGVSGWCESSS
jgi:hypothetical protein